MLKEGKVINIESICMHMEVFPYITVAQRAEIGLKLLEEEEKKAKEKKINKK